MQGTRYYYWRVNGNYDDLTSMFRVTVTWPHKAFEKSSNIIIGILQFLYSPSCLIFTRLFNFIKTAFPKGLTDSELSPRCA